MAQTLKEEVRARILGAAEEELYTRGPTVTMRQIAKAAGVTPGNLYRYYAGKEELLAAVTQPVMQGLDALVRRHTGELLALGQTEFAFPLGYGARGLAQLRGELYARFGPAFQDLCALAGQYPRPMAILCQQNEVSGALMDWFYALIQGALEALIQPGAAGTQVVDALVRTEGQAFCQGVIALMQQCRLLPPAQQAGFIQAYLSIHIEGILYLIEAAVQNGSVQYKEGASE